MHTYATAALAFAVSALAVPSEQEIRDAGARRPFLKSRQVTTELKDSYDFIVLGGGLAGLVVGNRLSADSGSSVLVIEAGSDGSEYADQISAYTNGQLFRSLLISNRCSKQRVLGRSMGYPYELGVHN